MSDPFTNQTTSPLVNVPELDLERIDPNQALREVYQAYPSLADQRLPQLTNNIVNPALTSTVNTVANEYLPAGGGFNYDGPFGYADTRQKLLGTAPNISLGPEVTWSRAQPRDTGGGIQPFKSNVYFDAGGSAAGMDIEDIVAGIQDAIKNTNVAGGTQIPEGYPEGTVKIDGGYGLPDGTAVPDAETQAEIDALIAQGNADLDAAGQGVDIGDIGGVQNVDVNAIDPAGQSTGGGGVEETGRAPGVEIVDNTGATSTTSTLQDWLGVYYTNNRVPTGAEGLQYNEATDNPLKPTYMLKPSVLAKLSASSEDLLKNISKIFDITTGKQRSQYGPRPENESVFAQQLKRANDLIKGRIDEGIKPFETRGTYTQLGDRTPYGIDVVSTLANLEEVIKNPENIKTQEYGDLQFRALVNWAMLYSQFGSQIGLPFAVVSLGDDILSAFGNLLGDNWEDRGNPVQDVVHYSIWKTGDIFKKSYDKAFGRALGKIKPGSLKDKLGKLTHNFDFDFGPNKQPQPKIRITFNKKPQEAPEFKGTLGGRNTLNVPPSTTESGVGGGSFTNRPTLPPPPPRTTKPFGMPPEGRGTFPKPPPQSVEATTLTTTPVNPTVSDPDYVTPLPEDPKDPKNPLEGTDGVDYKYIWLPYTNNEVFRGYNEVAELDTVDPSQIDFWERTLVTRNSATDTLSDRVGGAVEARGGGDYGGGSLDQLERDYFNAKQLWDARSEDTSDITGPGGISDGMGGGSGAAGGSGGMGGASGGGLGLTDPQNPNGWRNPNNPREGLDPNAPYDPNARWESDIPDDARRDLPRDHPQHEDNRPEWDKPLDGGFIGTDLPKPDPAVGWDSALPPTKIVRVPGPDGDVEEVHTIRTQTKWNSATNSWEYYKWYQAPNEVSPPGFIPFDAERVYPPGG